jgi:predicted enzyme related to lactoylglutathione lyase
VNDEPTTFCVSKALLALATLNFSSMVAFYTELLGQEPSVLKPDCYAQYDLPGLCLGLFQARLDRWPEFAQSQHSPLSLCLQVESLSAAIAHLTQVGATPPGSTLEASHGQEIYAYDPDGNRLILWSLST